MQSIIKAMTFKYPVLRYTNKNVVLRAINVGKDAKSLAELDKRPKEQPREQENKKKKLRNDISYHSVLLKRDMMGLSAEEQDALLMISTKGPGPIPKQTPTLTKPTTFNFTTASRSTKSKRQPLQPINKVVPVKRAIPNAYFDNESKGFDRPVQSYEHPMKKLAALVEGWKNEEEEGVTKPVKVQEVKQESEEMKMSDLDMDAWRREEEEEERKTAEKTSAQLEVTLQGIEERIAAIKRDNEERWQAILEFRRKRLRYVPIITLTLPDDDETWDATPYEKGPQDRKLLYPLWRQPEDIIILQTKQIIVKIEEEDEYDLSQNGLPYDFHVQHRRRDYERSTTPPDYIPERSSSSKGFY